MIEPVTFDIFEPAPDEFRISRSVIVFAMAIVWGLWTFIAGDLESPFLRLFSIVCFITIIYFSISSHFLQQPLHGQFDGEVEFTHQGIIFKGSPYYLSEISAINFSLDDYYNKYLAFPLKGLNQRYSQGVDNYVEFTVMHKDSYIIYFRCEDEDHHRLLDPFIEECIRLNKKRQLT